MKLRSIAFQLVFVGVASVAASLVAASGRAADAGAQSPERYSAEGGVVFDTRTGLHWQQTPASEAATWADGKAYCDALALHGSKWRLPSVAELQTLIDETRANPAIDPEAFPDTASEYFWTSSMLPRFTNFAWTVYFGSGLSTFFDVSSVRWVRCVY
jgi:hypothetical protein